MINHKSSRAKVIKTGRIFDIVEAHPPMPLKKGLVDRGMMPWPMGSSLLSDGTLYWDYELLSSE